jgi:mRNA-degrading endonuclease RelE of RelBE toxin-antitoxin system
MLSNGLLLSPPVRTGQDLRIVFNDHALEQLRRFPAVVRALVLRELPRFDPRHATKLEPHHLSMWSFRVSDHVRVILFRRSDGIFVVVEILTREGSYKRRSRARWGRAPETSKLTPIEDLPTFEEQLMSRNRQDATPAGASGRPCAPTAFASDEEKESGEFFRYAVAAIAKKETLPLVDQYNRVSTKLLEVERNAETKRARDEAANKEVYQRFDQRLKSVAEVAGESKKLAAEGVTRSEVLLAQVEAVGAMAKDNKGAVEEAKEHHRQTQAALESDRNSISAIEKQLTDVQNSFGSVTDTVREEVRSRSVALRRWVEEQLDAARQQADERAARSQQELRGEFLAQMDRLRADLKRLRQEDDVRYREEHEARLALEADLKRLREKSEARHRDEHEAGLASEAMIRSLTARVIRLETPDRPSWRLRASEVLARLAGRRNNRTARG